jgi:hypothetical protein
MHLIFLICDLDDLAVIHVDDAIRKLKNSRIVCDHNQSPIGTFGYAPQNVHDDPPSVVIQAAGGFIAYNQLWAVH